MFSSFQRHLYEAEYYNRNHTLYNCWPNMHESRLKLTDLNTYCILKIFNYLSEDDLLRLCEASHYLKGIIDSCIFYAKSKDLLLCGHANNPSIEKR